MNQVKVVLDVGCGESSETPRFLSEFVNGESVWVVGVDWSYVFCKKSKKIARKRDLNAEYVRCDIAFLPFRDATFHIVCMLDSLRCLKGHSPEEFLKEEFLKLLPDGELYIVNIDRVSFQQRNLPAFKDHSLPLSWSVYVPRNESSPFISEEPDYTKAKIKERYKYVGILPERFVSELLWRCGVEPETIWKTEKEGIYSYHRYVATAKKRRL